MGIKLSLVGNYYAVGILDLQAVSAWAITLFTSIDILHSGLHVLITNAGGMWVVINFEELGINMGDSNCKLDQNLLKWGP